MKNIKLKEYREKMESAVEKIMSGDRFKRYLQSIHMFRQYSFSNTILIFLQKPGSTRVAGMKTWNKLGRRVKKGEKGIALFAPVFRKEKSKEEDIEDGVSEETDSTKEMPHLSGFCIRYVFDISQTEGEDISLDEFRQRTQYTMLDIVESKILYDMILSVCPVRVEYDNLPYNGDYSPELRLIRINTSLPSMERPRTLIHEMAHAMAIDTREHTMTVGDRPMGEVIAEGAAFVVCSYYGLDTSSYSFAYIAAWGKDMKKILSWGNAVTRIANKLIDLIDSAPIATKKAA